MSTPLAAAYTEAQLQADFGQRWTIWHRKYEDGWQLAAVPRPPEPGFIPLARPDPAAMRDCLSRHMQEGHR